MDSLTEIHGLPKAIFFDWDGTLVNSLSFLTKAHNYAKEKLGLPFFKDDDFAHYLGMPREQLYMDIYGEKYKDQAKAYFEEYVHEFHTKEIPPIDDVQELLDLIYGLNIPCGVVSNKKAVFLKEEIRAFGWEKYFRCIIGAGDASEDKPSSAPLLLALEKSCINASHDEVWYIGDTEFDVACAQSCGARAVIVTPPYEDGKRFEKQQQKPDLILDNHSGLIKFIQKMHNL